MILSVPALIARTTTERREGKQAGRPLAGRAGNCANVKTQLDLYNIGNGQSHHTAGASNHHTAERAKNLAKPSGVAREGYRTVEHATR